jgi:PAS domain S-box-containing protein
MSPTSNRKLRWFNGVGGSGLMIWAIVVGACLILAVVFILVQQAIKYEREDAFENAQDTNSKIVLSDEIRIRSLLASLDKVMLVVRKDLAVNPKLAGDEILQRLEDMKVDGEFNPRIFVVNAAGDVVLSPAHQNGDSMHKINIADREFFQKQKFAMNDLLDVGEPVIGRFSGKWVVPLSRRITNKDGSFGGILHMTVDPKLFTEPFEKTGFGDNTSRAIIGLDGHTLLRLNNGKLSYGGDVRKSQLFNEIQKSAVGCYTAVATADGVNRYVCYRVVDTYSFVIAAGSAVASIEEMYMPKVWGYIIAASVFGGLILLLSVMLIVGILRQRKVLVIQQSFNQLIELVPQLVSSMDVHGNVLWVNRRTIDYIKPSPEEQAAGFDWVLSGVHPDDLEHVQRYISSALTQEQVSEFCECRRRRHDGAYLWFSSQMTRVVGQEGVGSYFLQTSTEIHDRKMAEERARVAQKLESIGQLTGGMAHDFNNLLAIIVGNLDLVKPDVKVDAATKRLDVAIGAAQRGVSLVKALLALASKQPLLPATVDLWALIERISPLLRHALGQRVNFAMKPPGANVHVEVDEAGLEAVLLNLIVNAKDAMLQGGDLTLGLDVTNGMARIVVKDTGTGMPDAVLKRATEPFFTTKDRGRGTGLGLSMVAGFAKQSGGTMKIQSAEGVGTTIEIALPLALVANTVSTQGKPITMPSQQAVTTTKLKILIVDDEPALAELVRDWAKAEGHTAVVAHSADDALTLLEVRAFDVLLSDIVMPGQLDGIGLAERATVMHPAMKILLMSGYSRETATNRADVPWHLLVKPFSNGELEAALEKTYSVSGFDSLA